MRSYTKLTCGVKENGLIQEYCRKNYNKTGVKIRDKVFHVAGLLI